MGRYLVLCALQYSATPDPKGPPTLYQPGEIVNLTAAAAAPLLASGVVMLDPADTVASFTAATAVHLATSDAADLAGVVAASLGSVAVAPADYATQSARATLAAKKNHRYRRGCRNPRHRCRRDGQALGDSPHDTCHGRGRRRRIPECY